SAEPVDGRASAAHMGKTEGRLVIRVASGLSRTLLLRQGDRKRPDDRWAASAGTCGRERKGSGHLIPAQRTGKVVGPERPDVTGVAAVPFHAAGRALNLARIAAVGLHGRDKRSTAGLAHGRHRSRHMAGPAYAVVVRFDLQRERAGVTERDDA